METKALLVIILSFGAGLFSIMASFLDWGFFFESRKAQFFVNILGRRGARIFYGLLGLFLVFLGFKILNQT